MRNFLRGGRGLSYGQGVNDLSNHPTKENKRLRDRLLLPLGRYRSDGKDYEPKQIVLIIPMIIFCVLFSLAAVTPVFGQEADGLSRIKSLQIGDTIPDELWNMPLQVVNHPEGKEVITLNDYRDKKLIILDFWATWCSSCLKAIHEKESLNEIFADDLALMPITVQDEDVVKDKSFYSIVNAPLLSRVFPHRLIPHYVWITASGKVVSFTGPNEVNRENIQKKLEGSQLIVNSKIDVDPSWPLFADSSLIPEHGTLNSYNIFYSGYVPGLPSMSSFRKYRDASNRVLLTNLTASRAMRKLLVMMWDRYSKRRIIYEGLDENEERSAKQLFTVDVINDNVSVERLSRNVFEAIASSSLFNYELQTVPQECLVLSFKGRAVNPVGGDSKGVSLIRISNWLEGISPTSDLVIDETGMENILADSKEFVKVDWDKAISILDKYGIEVKKDIREVELCIVSKRN